MCKCAWIQIDWNKPRDATGIPTKHKVQWSEIENKLPFHVVQRMGGSYLLVELLNDDTSGEGAQRT